MLFSDCLYKERLVSENRFPLGRPIIFMLTMRDKTWSRLYQSNNPARRQYYKLRNYMNQAIKREKIVVLKSPHWAIMNFLEKVKIGKSIWMRKSFLTLNNLANPILVDFILGIRSQYYHNIKDEKR